MLALPEIKKIIEAKKKERLIDYREVAADLEFGRQLIAYITLDR